MSGLISYAPSNLTGPVTCSMYSAKAWNWNGCMFLVKYLCDFRYFSCTLLMKCRTHYVVQGWYMNKNLQ